MLSVEEAQAEHEQAAGTLQKIEGEWQRRLQSLQEEQTQLARRVNELLAQREQMVPRIPAEMLRVYEAAARQGNGLAVAVLQQNRCQACSVTVSATKARAVSEGQLVYCGSCGRILSMPGS
jgi:predicted  nucleic acid-binding Zn-ribbon protein